MKATALLVALAAVGGVLAHEPPKHPYEPPKHPYEPPKHPYEPPKHPYEPPKHPYEPPKHPYEPPKHPYHPPTKPHKCNADNCLRGVRGTAYGLYPPLPTRLADCKEYQITVVKIYEPDVTKTKKVYVTKYPHPHHYPKPKPPKYEPKPPKYEPKPPKYEPKPPKYEPKPPKYEPKPPKYEPKPPKYEPKPPKYEPKPPKYEPKPPKYEPKPPKYEPKPPKHHYPREAEAEAEPEIEERGEYKPGPRHIPAYATYCPSHERYASACECVGYKAETKTIHIPGKTIKVYVTETVKPPKYEKPPPKHY